MAKKIKMPNPRTNAAMAALVKEYRSKGNIPWIWIALEHVCFDPAVLAYAESQLLGASWDGVNGKSGELCRLLITYGSFSRIPFDKMSLRTPHADDVSNYILAAKRKEY